MWHSGLACLWAEPNGIEGWWLFSEFIRMNLGAANGI